MLTALLILCGLSVLLPDVVSGAVCKQTYTVQTYSTGESYYSCGWWGWSKCRQTKKVMTPVKKTRSFCCPGSFGTVDINGCNGVCPFEKTQIAEACSGKTCRDFQCGLVTDPIQGIQFCGKPYLGETEGPVLDESKIVNTPDTSQLVINENDDQERLLWTANATCFVQESCPCASGGSSTCKCSKIVPCTDCTVQSTHQIAEVRAGTKVFRKKCSNTKCSDCRQYPGCLNNGVNYVIKVKCRASGYDDNDVITQTFTLNVTKAPEAKLEFPKIDVPIKVDTDASVGDVLLKFGAITIPSGENNVVYSLRGPNSTSTGQPLFKYNETTREIRVNSDLSQEEGGTFTVQLCINLRRKATCFGVLINLERITTTTTSTTTTTTTAETTTTTTVQPDTTVPAGAFRCFGTGPYALQHGMDIWCQEVCGRDQTACATGNVYSAFCACIDLTADPADMSDEEPQQICRAGGLFASSPGGTDDSYLTRTMSAWCELNCNHGDYSYCPGADSGKAGYCICD